MIENVGRGWVPRTLTIPGGMWATIDDGTAPVLLQKTAQSPTFTLNTAAVLCIVDRRSFDKFTG